jgi:hypothetical protein
MKGIHAAEITEELRLDFPRNILSPAAEVPHNSRILALWDRLVA